MNTIYCIRDVRTNEIWEYGFFTRKQAESSILVTTSKVKETRRFFRVELCECEEALTDVLDYVTHC